MVFDYIIIGAGSAGCVLANRLSENQAVSVLLIEAGGRDNAFTLKVPGGFMKLHRSNVDWNCYWTVPQPQLDNRRIYHPRGKVLGGCSSTNAMVYVRGQREDFDHWKQLGNNGWSYDEVLPFFRKSEHNEQFANEFHSTKGLLHVTHALRHRTPMARAFIESCLQAGIPLNDDFNGTSQEGVGWFQHTMKDNKRHSAATAFLLPAMPRKNLKVVSNTLVKRIVIEQERASAVEVAKGKRATEKIEARKEIILAAGAFASPQLLMLSGIGPSDQLKHAGIQLKRNIPGVGQNLQDHLFYPVSSLCNKPLSNNQYISIYGQAKALMQYMLFKKGPLTVGPLEACAFLKSSPDLKRPDIQLEFTPTHVGNDYTVDPYDLKTLPRTDGYTILPTQARPESRGTLMIDPVNPFGPPRIDPRYLSHEKDREILVRACRKALDVLEQPAFDAFRIVTHCPAQRNSDDHLLRHIQKSAECVYHPVGTCKMGNDEASVVDEQLRVHGIAGLRVADASIMPTLTSGNTNAPVIMIAEKASEIIKSK